MKSSELETALVSILARLGRLPADQTSSLRPPAGPEARARLAGTVCGEPTLPEPLEVWFACHDGQELGTLGVDPEAPAVAWMSIDDAIDAWMFLNDENEEILPPWSRDWLPIATNGGGDYLVYAIRGADAGTLLFYYHDDEDRPVEAASVAEYASKVERSLADVEASLEEKRTIPTRVSEDGAIWQDAPAPTADDLRVAPIGTAFHRRSLPYRSYWYRVYVKLGEGVWIAGKAQSQSPHRDDDFEITGALTDIERLVQDELPRAWKQEEGALVEALSDESIYPAGLTALGGRPARGDAYFIRRRTTLTVRQ
jgi:cell wall assembly regulator SMI1